jgi:hypothetical protein
MNFKSAYHSMLLAAGIGLLSVSCSTDKDEGVYRAGFFETSNELASVKSAQVLPGTLYAGLHGYVAIQYNDDGKGPLSLTVDGFDNNAAITATVVSPSLVRLVAGTFEGSTKMRCTLTDGDLIRTFDVPISVTIGNPLLVQGFSVTSAPLLADSTNIVIDSILTVDVSGYAFASAPADTLTYTPVSNMLATQDSGNSNIYHFVMDSFSGPCYYGFTISSTQMGQHVSISDMRSIDVVADMTGRVVPEFSDMDLSAGIVMLRDSGSYALISTSGLTRRLSEWQFCFASVGPGLYTCEVWVDRNNDGVVGVGDFWGTTFAKELVSSTSEPRLFAAQLVGID